MSTKRLDCLGRLSYHGVLIPLKCTACGHFAEVQPGDLILRFGWAAEPERIPWRCSKCGADRTRILVGRAARMAR
ncbi:hypothetical protein [Azospirillum canadense]|uniref:hypothetical protein n=1 Tax=Azospirillum canadense TaxID=403962 RepID=UPI002227C702|nr:hypothetical protein [Azospirillum canadense]MCW2242297.1 Zn finger protein HypA/HybF involved in hydrogenase expression [Azospirillum canadense]